jgi:hypothetical protein
MTEQIGPKMIPPMTFRRALAWRRDAVAMGFDRPTWWDTVVWYVMYVTGR